MGLSLSFPTVQLLHEPGDGTCHVDWMIAQDPRGREPLVTFRLAGRVDDLAGGGTLPAQRIGDHRPAWLTREGPVSGNRGKVRRLARGVVVLWERRPDAWRIQVDWEAADSVPRRQSLLLEPQRDGAWRIEALAG